ncbi:MAG: methyltransferase domain-containing protein [Pseudomonadota bacterium]
MTRWKHYARKAAAIPVVGPILYRLHEWRQSRKLPPSPQADEHGVPIPSAYLIHLIGGQTDWRSFLSRGETSIERFKSLVDANGGDFRNARRILDFGCGCGRLARHLPQLTRADIYGVDLNPRLIRWSQENLKGHFAQNRLAPPLDFPDEHFDIIYLLSVFTHLHLETQNAWLEEFARLTIPGGFTLATFHDEDHPGLESAGLHRDALLDAGFLVGVSEMEGSNLAATFQSCDFARQQFATYFDVCAITPSTDGPIGQAVAVLRRRP